MLELKNKELYYNGQKIELKGIKSIHIVSSEEVLVTMENNGSVIMSRYYVENNELKSLSMSN